VTDVAVAIIGSGLAGLAAANAAIDEGCEEIMVIDAEPVVGGSSRLSGGIVMGAGTRYQRELGIHDDPQDLFREYMAWTGWQVDAGIVRELCLRSGSTIDWLGELGVPFTGKLVVGGDEAVPRSHLVRGGGQAIIDTLVKRCREHGVDIAPCRRVDRLLVEDGRVCGVGVEDDTLSAAATVLATGGFGACHGKLATHYPSAVTVGPSSWYIGAEGARGDALDIGAQVSAQLIGHDRGLRLLHPDFGRVIDAYLPGWMVVVDGHGQRFYDESAPYGVVDDIFRLHADVGYAVFDDAALRANNGPSFKDPLMERMMASTNWTEDTIDEQVRSGKARVAVTVEDLAEQLGLPPESLRATIDRYNAFQESTGGDLEFCKPTKFLRQVVQPPFYGVQLRPATICLTSFGLRVDRAAQVIDTKGNPIEGLFAAGECTGGVLGDRYLGSGNSLGNCATVGRLAGTSAARAARADLRAVTRGGPTWED
jgi:fumarate reductase flavoprotein subunit